MDQPGASLRDERHRRRPKDSPPTRILFVCTGNVCRSAFAEACLKGMLTDSHRVEVSSAGITALVGSEMDPLMAQEAESRGIDPSEHCARQLTGRMLKSADIVLVFGPEHVAWIAAECPEVLDRVVALGQAAAVRQAQPRLAALEPTRLVADVRRLRAQPQPDDWIGDPYRQGARAASIAAERIEHDITVLMKSTGLARTGEENFVDMNGMMPTSTRGGRK